MTNKDLVEVNTKPMKKIFTFTTPLFITLLFTLNVFAQQNDAEQGKGNIDLQEMSRRQTEALEDVVGLTADQLKQVDSVNNVFAEELQTYYTVEVGDRSNGRGELISMMNRKDVALKSILTHQQWVALVQWRNEDRKANRSAV